MAGVAAACAFKSKLNQRYLLILVKDNSECQGALDRAVYAMLTAKQRLKTTTAKVDPRFATLWAIASAK
jgi:hypothetical protein